MKGIIFKQRYKSLKDENVALLNRKHLIYIATRPGAIHNYGAGFGLFGKMPGMETSGVINDFERAKKVVTAVSHRRTIYRVTLSLDDKTAKEKGYYNRAEWEKLAYKNMEAIAKEMNISPRSMCWAASYHHARGHPHIHVMYWDNSTKIREEHVEPQRFKIVEERVKAAFNSDIFKDELLELHERASEETKLIRMELRALCRECNVADALNLGNVSQLKLSQVGEQLRQLVLNVPPRGRLTYAYLPEAYKAQVDECVDSIMQITDFKLNELRLSNLADQMSEYYGNGLDKTIYNREKTVNKLRSGLGNEILGFIKEYQRDLGARVPADLRGQAAEIRRVCLQSISENDVIAKTYNEVLHSFPTERTPRQILMNDEERLAQYHELRTLLQEDVRVRTQIRACAAHWMQQPRDDLDVKTARSEAFRQASKIFDHEVYQMLYQDAGYQFQEEADMALTVMLNLFQFASQSTRQQQNQFQLDRHRGAELSETARKDLYRKQEQEGGWSL